MGAEGRAAGDRARAATGARSHLFAVRLWRAEAAAGPEYRGSVREVVSGAFRNFRDWSDLAAFMIVRVEEAEGAPADEIDGGRRGDVSGGDRRAGDGGAGSAPAPIDR